MIRYLPLAALLAVAACTSAQVAQTQTTVTTACALAPVLTTSSPTVTADVAKACADEAVVEPVVAPLIPAPAATTTTATPAAK